MRSWPPAPCASACFFFRPSSSSNSPPACAIRSKTAPRSTVELAEALAEAGRSSEAADQFLRAAAANEADPKRAAPLIDRAAQQMLYSGRLVEGHAAYRKLFTNLGVAFPETARQALRMSLVNRIWFALRLTRRPRGDATARLELLWAAAKGFLILDLCRRRRHLHPLPARGRGRRRGVRADPRVGP